MKFSRLSGFIGISNLFLLIISFFFIILFITSFLGLVLIIISTVLLFFLICTIIASFFERHVESSYLFRRRRKPNIIHLGQYYNIIYGILLLIFGSIFLGLSLLYSEGTDEFYNANSSYFVIIVSSLWLVSGINAIIAGVLYNEKMSEKERKKEYKRLERKQLQLIKESDKKGKKLEKIRIAKAQFILNVEAKIKEIENDEILSDQEKTDKIKLLIDKLKTLNL